jgi:hypothetical protein
LQGFDSMQLRANITACYMHLLTHNQKVTHDLVGELCR